MSIDNNALLAAFMAYDTKDDGELRVRKVITAYENAKSANYAEGDKIGSGSCSSSGLREQESLPVGLRFDSVNDDLKNQNRTSPSAPTHQPVDSSDLIELAYDHYPKEKDERLDRACARVGFMEGVCYGRKEYEPVLEDHKRLVREMDVALNGIEGAAKQASLCDIVSQVKSMKRESSDLIKRVDALAYDCRKGEPISRDEIRTLCDDIKKALNAKP